MYYSKEKRDRWLCVCVYFILIFFSILSGKFMMNYATVGKEGRCRKNKLCSEEIRSLKKWQGDGILLGDHACVIMSKISVPLDSPYITYSSVRLYASL